MSQQTISFGYRVFVVSGGHLERPMRNSEDGLIFEDDFPSVEAATNEISTNPDVYFDEYVLLPVVVKRPW